MSGDATEARLAKKYNDAVDELKRLRNPALSQRFRATAKVMLALKNLRAYQAKRNR